MLKKSRLLVHVVTVLTSRHHVYYTELIAIYQCKVIMITFIFTIDSILLGSSAKFYDPVMAGARKAHVSSGFRRIRSTTNPVLCYMRLIYNKNAVFAIFLSMIYNNSLRSDRFSRL